MKNNVLPDREQALEMILRLEAPFQTMAWVMLETGAKFSDVQALRVRDVQLDRGWVMIGGRRHDLSAGLMEAVDDYLRRIFRPAFEAMKRSAAGSTFSARKLFPAWMLDGYEHQPVDAVFPVTEYVAALHHASASVGFRGMVNSNTLRLVAAREWLRQGMPVTALHERLGHRDLMTTMLLAQSLQHGGLTFAAAA
jgi:integrase